MMVEGGQSRLMNGGGVPAHGLLLRLSERLNTVRQELYLRGIVTVNCAKCGKEIPAGQEVKKGFLTKKSYHKGCEPLVRTYIVTGG